MLMSVTPTHARIMVTAPTSPISSFVHVCQGSQEVVAETGNFPLMMRILLWINLDQDLVPAVAQDVSAVKGHWLLYWSNRNESIGMNTVNLHHSKLWVKAKICFEGPFFFLIPECIIVIYLSVMATYTPAFVCRSSMALESVKILV